MTGFLEQSLIEKTIRNGHIGFSVPIRVEPKNHKWSFKFYRFTYLKNLSHRSHIRSQTEKNAVILEPLRNQDCSHIYELQNF